VFLVAAEEAAAEELQLYELVPGSLESCFTLVALLLLIGSMTALVSNELDQSDVQSLLFVAGFDAAAFDAVVVLEVAFDE